MIQAKTARVEANIDCILQRYLMQFGSNLSASCDGDTVRADQRQCNSGAGVPQWLMQSALHLSRIPNTPFGNERPPLKAAQSGSDCMDRRGLTRKSPFVFHKLLTVVTILLRVTVQKTSAAEPISLG